MERIGLSIILAGLVVAFVASLPFVVSVVGNFAQPHDLASNLIWQGWLLGAAVSFVGLLVTAFSEFAPPGRRAV